MSEHYGEIQTALLELESEDLETRVNAVMKLGKAVYAIMESLRQALVDEEESQGLICERLQWLAEALREPFERTIESSPEDHGMQFMAAAVLANFKSDKGIDTLLNMVRYGHPECCYAASILARANVREVIAPVERALLVCDIKDTKMISCLTGALQKLKWPLSPEIRERISGMEPAWLRDGLLRE